MKNYIFKKSFAGMAALVALVIFVLLGVSRANNATNTTNGTNSVPPPKPEPSLVTPRDFFNAGTRKLAEKKLPEAEALFQKALAQQDQSVRPTALYNLGHVRFTQGAEELKKSLQAGPTAARGRSATEQANQAIQQANAALAGGEIPKMVDAYLNGRGARRELKAAKLAVTRALEMHGVVLQKWERSLGDFKGALELNPADTNAQHNVKVVERAIAKLVDMMEELQKVAMGMTKPDKDLGEKIKQLRGQIPEPDAPPGSAGDEEEEEDGKPREPKEGQQEGPNKDGREIFLTPEQAGWLLEQFKLGGDRRLPMGQGEETKPKDRKGRNW